ncbi:alpha/beta hydrolase fold domain-containing protein [Zavarzinia sp. CC-PAN008]|uniref:alpha/beta hydrolase fold domain-containing protein n=1 Tax=Zavarzinia sp. CC-PAN008 TaxID=3243332 RepID=UPI003F746392
MDPAVRHELDTLTRALAHMPSFGAVPLATLRAADAELSPRVAGASSGVACRAERVGGVPGLWADPPGASADAAILLLHGGGFVSGSAAGHWPLAAVLAQDSGIAVFVADYRLAPEHPFPAARDDAVAAWRTLAERHGARNVAVVGDSAGGGLALALMQHERDAGRPVPAQTVLWSPWADLTVPLVPRGPVGATAIAALRAMAALYLGPVPAHSASPLHAAFDGLPPLLIRAGTRELLRDEAVHLAGLAGAAGVAVRLCLEPFMPHVYPCFAGILSAGRAAIRTDGQALRKMLAGQAASATLPDKSVQGPRGRSTMSTLEEVQAFRAMLAQAPKPTELDLAGSRAAIDAMGAASPVAPDIRIEPVTIGKAKAEWSTAPGASAQKAILYLHGGGYVIGSLDSHRGLATELGRAAGMRVLALDYRLAPEHPFPAAVEDAIAAYEHILAQGIPASGVVIAGDSAGGGLAVATLLMAREMGLPLPAAGFCISPWVDLEMTGSTMDSKAAEDPLLQRADLQNFATPYLNGADPKHPHASPLQADLSGLPPLLIHVGSAEVLLDDAIRLAAKAGAADVKVQLEVWPHMIHIWHFFSAMLSDGRRATAEAARFLRNVTGG